MHLLDRYCVIVGRFLKLHATFPNRRSLGGDVHISRSCCCFGSRSCCCSALALACAAALLFHALLLHEQQILLPLEPLQLLLEMLLHDQLPRLSHALLLRALLLLLLFCY